MNPRHAARIRATRLIMVSPNLPAAYRLSATEFRDLVVVTASAEVGEALKGSSKVLRFWQGAAPSMPAATRQAMANEKDYCGAFALFCYREAGIAPPGAVWTISRGFASMLPLLPRTERPVVGDLVVFADKWHHALIERVTANDLFTIDGNSSFYDSVQKVWSPVGVWRRKRPLSTLGQRWYYSIQPWIDAAVGAQ